jgi:hypothetical protein
MRVEAYTREGRDQNRGSKFSRRSLGISDMRAIDRVKNGLNTVADVLSSASAMLEAFNRVWYMTSEADAEIRKNGTDVKGPEKYIPYLSYYTIATVDFSQKGGSKAIRYASKVTPFLAASLNAMVKDVDIYFLQGKKSAATLGKMLGLMLAVYIVSRALTGDDDEDMPEYEKMQNYIPFGKTDDGTIIRMPVPRGLEAVGLSLWNVLGGTSDDNGMTISSTIEKQFVPSLHNIFIDVARMAMDNRDSFGNEILKSRADVENYQKGNYSEITGSYVSPLANIMSTAMSGNPMFGYLRAPKVMEKALNNFFGDFGKIMSKGPGVVKERVKKQFTYDLDSSTQASQYSGNIYDLQEEYDEGSREYKFLSKMLTSPDNLENKNLSYIAPHLNEDDNIQGVTSHSNGAYFGDKMLESLPSITYLVDNLDENGLVTYKVRREDGSDDEYEVDIDFIREYGECIENVIKTKERYVSEVPERQAIFDSVYSYYVERPHIVSEDVGEDEYGKTTSKNKVEYNYGLDKASPYYVSEVMDEGVSFADSEVKRLEGTDDAVEWLWRLKLGQILTGKGHKTLAKLGVMADWNGDGEAELISIKNIDKEVNNAIIDYRSGKVTTKEYRDILWSANGRKDSIGRFLSELKRTGNPSDFNPENEFEQLLYSQFTTLTSQDKTNWNKRASG